MSPRAVTSISAAASIALVLAQDVWPQWPGFHTWQYAAALAIGATAIAAYILGARRGEDGEAGRRFAIAMVGALVVIAAGLAAGLLGPDTEIVARAPGTVAPLADAGVAAFFPVADATAISRGDGHVLLRRRGAADIDVAPHGRRFVGATVVEVAPKIAAYVEARTRGGEHLTVTQPTNAAFLSPVLLFAQQVAIAGKTLPADAFAIPARHRQVKAFYFPAGASPTAASGHAAQNGSPSVLFAVDDDDGRLIAGGIGFATSGATVELGGLRLRATLGTYPALAVSAVPLPLALWLGIGLVAVGSALAFGGMPHVMRRTSGRVA
ncbi:MAG: hypothetical protein NVS1B2_07790 [Vulcanimicrobiaceae bacterium]